MTPLDERVLELLAAEGWATPRGIARRVSLRASVGRVRERCAMLAAAGLVAPVSAQLLQYELTSAGHRYLAGELDVSARPRPSVSR